MVKAWLINSMEPKIGRTYLSYKTVKEIWDMVPETYSDIGNTTQIFELKSLERNNTRRKISHSVLQRIDGLMART